jgi:apolipoprotein N-acyltransferase
MTPLFQETQLTGEIRLGEGGTFYATYGDVFALTTVVVSLAAAILLYTKKRDRRK